MTTDERSRTLDAIRQHSDHLTELARRYDRLRWMAEKDASDAFLQLAETAGKMTRDQLAQLGTLLDIMWQVGSKEAI